MISTIVHLDWTLVALLLQKDQGLKGEYAQTKYHWFQLFLDDIHLHLDHDDELSVKHAQKSHERNY